MRCPECGAASRVLETNRVTGEEGDKYYYLGDCTTRRRRECTKGHRFTTLERPQGREAEAVKNIDLDSLKREAQKEILEEIKSYCGPSLHAAIEKLRIDHQL